MAFMKTLTKLFSLTLIALCLSFTAAFSQINFTMDVTTGCYPLTVTFTNTSTVGSSYYIFFDDGTGDFLVGSDTTHTYTYSGWFNITLYAYDSLGNYIGSNFGSLQVNMPVSDFYMSDTVVCPGTNVSFNSNSNGSNFFWDFGDGDTASGQWANHTYATLGSYNCTLVMTTSCGIDTLIQGIVVDSTGITPAQFGFWPNPVCPLQPVSFYPYSNEGTAWYWDFGDGDTSILSNPFHAFDSTGFFNITFVLTNGCGNNDTATSQIEVKANAGWPPMNLGFNPQVCPGESTNISAPPGFLSYVFDFGDGSPTDSTNFENVNHVFASTGSYIVSVTVYNFCGNDTIITVTMVISNNVPLPNEPWFEVQTNNLICPGEQIQINVPGGYLAYVYNFGDGSPADSSVFDGISHTYLTVGIYELSVKIYNHCGNDSIIVDTITVSATAPFNPGISINSNSPVCPGEAGFNAPQGMVYYIWDFGDGSPLDSSNQENANHIYDSTNTYTVSCQFQNYCGNDTILSTTVVVANNIGFPPFMQAYAFPNPVCPGDEMSLNADNGYSSYFWDFGDGVTVSSGDDRYAEHTYDSVGTYTYSVTIVNGCGLDTTITGGILVDANAPFPSQMQINLSSNIVCPGDAVNFDADDNWTLYFWDFGGGDTLTTTQGYISHTFDSVGIFPVSVTLWNGCGNQTTLYTSIVVDSNNTMVDAKIQVLNTNLCPGDEFTVGPQDDDGTSFLYYWDLDDGTLDTTIGVGVTHSYADTGVYVITVIATNACGYSASSTVTVTVTNNAVPSLGDGDDFFGIATEGSTAGCAGDAILFFFAGTYANVWDFGDGSSGSAVNSIQTSFGAFAIITHVYQNVGTYWATLTITNNCGNSITDSVQVVIGSGLAVSGDLFAESPSGGGAYTTCEGVGFLAMGGTSYDYDFGDGVSITTTSSSMTHFYDSAGTYVVTVTMTNACGNTGTYNIVIEVVDGGGATATALVSNTLTCNGSAEI